jgi:large subunit ribosomal protein L21
MEKYAVIQLGARQYTIHEGDVFSVERQTEKAKPVVLMFNDGKKTVLDAKELKEVAVSLKKISDYRDTKIVVGRFKSKSRYHKKRGHRQMLTSFKVEAIGSKVKEAVEAKSAEVKPVEEKPVVKAVNKKEVKTAVKAKKASVKKLVKKEVK